MKTWAGADAPLNIPTPERFHAPAPEPLENAPGPLTFVRILRDNPISALTKGHFQQAIVFTHTVLGPIAVVSDPAAIRWVLLDNSANYRRERVQRRMMEVPFGTSLLAA